MKVRESGMPEEELWASFFNVEVILSELQISQDIEDLVEIGCGYGTFTIPAARKIRGKLYTFDIEESMLDIVEQKLRSESVGNVITGHRDVILNSTGLGDRTIDYVMLFNILHHESPSDFLDEAFRILKPGGKVGILHWRSDIDTPRGPDLSIRPKPEEILKWINNNEFSLLKAPVVIEPYHFGLVLERI